MKYLTRFTLISLAIVLLTTSCTDDASEALPTACANPVKIGDSFVLDGKAVTVLELHSDKWCSCCETCNCFAIQSAVLQVEEDTVSIGGQIFSATLLPHTGVHEGRTITLEELEDGTCEDQLAPEDFTACFSID